VRRLRHQAGRVRATHRENRGPSPEKESRLSSAADGPEKLEIEREARVENVAEFRRFIEDACRRSGVDESVCFDLKLVVDEACSNLVIHGYQGLEPGPIGVSFARDGDQIVITITDHAPPFHPKDAPIPRLDAPAEERRPGGLGWHLIRELVDRMDYEADEKRGNRLTLVKRFVPRQNPDPTRGSRS
jgi:serine/threonine-protein kinase RsbW